MIVFLLYKVTWKVLSAASVLLCGEAEKDSERLVLRHENAVLRRQLTGQIHYGPADRFWFATLSRSSHPQTCAILPSSALANRPLRR